MTETQKTKAALLAENPDNTSGAITPEIIRNQIVSTFSEYGGIRFSANAVSTSLPVQNTWYQVDKFDTNGPYDGATPDHTNDHVTVGATGTYEVTLTCSFGGTGNHTYELCCRKNNGASAIDHVCRTRKIGTGGDVGALAASDIDTLTAGDTVEVWARCTSGAGNNITITNASMYIRQLSGV